MPPVSKQHAVLVFALIALSSLARPQDRLRVPAAVRSPYDFIARTVGRTTRYESVNVAQGAVVSLSHEGLTLRSRRAASWRFGLSLECAFGVTRQTADGNVAIVERGPISEWVISSDLGVEQGFRIARRLEEPLALELRVVGDLSPQASGDGRIVFTDRRGDVVLHYGEVFAFDAHGTSLSASRRVSGDAIVIDVDDAGAVYPVTIDPLITTQDVKLTDAMTVDPVANARFGYAVAAGAKRLVVGAPGDDTTVERSGAVYVFHHDGTSWVLEQKLQALDAAVDDRFGISVGFHEDEVLGSRIVVGAPGHEVEFEPGDLCAVPMPCCTPLGMNCGGGSFEPRDCAFGSAYVFRRVAGSWLQEAQLFAQRGGAYEGSFNDQFGEAVAIHGDTIAVGARFDEEDCENCNGDPNCFDCPDFAGDSDCRPCWTEPSGPYRSCPGPSIDSGSVYVYRHDGTAWHDDAKLFASDAARLDWFGSSIALDGDTLVVGARRKAQLDPAFPDDPLAGIGAWGGAAYVFERFGGDWLEKARLHRPGVLPVEIAVNAFDEFGTSVSVSGDTVVVGARYGDVGVTNPGTAYVFRKDVSGWPFEQQLVAPDGDALDRFGNSVAVEGDSVVIGARHHRASGTESTGAAYLFQRVGFIWRDAEKFTSTDAELLDLFGYSVDVAGGLAVTGAVLEDTIGQVESEHNAGSAYVFELSPFLSFCFGDGPSDGACTDCPCDNTAPPGSGRGCLNSSGDGAQLVGSGRPSIHDDTMQFDLNGAPAGSFALLVSGLNRLPGAGVCARTDTGIANATSTDGLRCVGGSLLRHGARATDANGDVVGPWTDLVAFGGLRCGDTRAFQVFFRDVPTACNQLFGTSNAVEVTLVP